MNDEIMIANLRKTAELTDQLKEMRVQVIMSENPGIDKKEAEKLFWQEMRRIKDMGLKE